jgi:hypothetical protein
VEVVHVELADKRCQVVVLEVGWEDLLAELGRLLDDKGSAFRIPVNNIREFSFLKNIVGFSDKRGNRVLNMGLGFDFAVFLGFRSHVSHFKGRKREGREVG